MNNLKVNEIKTEMALHQALFPELTVNQYIIFSGFIKNKSGSEIADDLRTNQTNVNQTLRRALRKLNITKKEAHNLFTQRMLENIYNQNL